MCFLLDITGSMDPQKDAVVEKIFDIVNRSNFVFPEVALHVGFVGYRDVEDSQQFEVIPFTENRNDFEERLRTIQCSGGGDEAEDVLGGMNHALNSLDWSGANIKVMFHIGDSPHHGSLFHDPASGCDDDHSELENRPRSYHDILGEYADLHVDYNFAIVENPRHKITTRKMAQLFERSYNSCQSKRNVFGIVDLTDFSPDTLFEKVFEGLSGSIQAFVLTRVKRGLA